MCAGRSASDEIDLASQPTMTRLENRLSRKELFDIGEAFIDDFIASYDLESDSIIIDAKYSLLFIIFSIFILFRCVDNTIVLCY